MRNPATASCRATALKVAEDERPLCTTPSATWLSIHTKTLHRAPLPPARKVQHIEGHTQLEHIDMLDTYATMTDAD